MLRLSFSCVNGSHAALHFCLLTATSGSHPIYLFIIFYLFPPCANIDGTGKRIEVARPVVDLDGDEVKYNLHILLRSCPYLPCGFSLIYWNLDDQNHLGEDQGNAHFPLLEGTLSTCPVSRISKLFSDMA